MIGKTTSLLAVALLLVSGLAPGQQAKPVSPPPKPEGEGPSLADTMKFIQDELSDLEKVSSLFYPHNDQTGKDFTSVRRTIYLTSPSADATACQISFHWKVTDDDQVGVNTDAGFHLRDIENVVVMSGEQAQKEVDTSDGHPELSSRFDPPLFAVKALKAHHHSNVFYFYDEDLANRVAKAMVHAVELCGEQAAADLKQQLASQAASSGSDNRAPISNLNDAVSTYHRGVAYLQMTPPDFMDGFWAIARSISLNVPKAPEVKNYLRSSILAYEQPGCSSIADAQLDELVNLAAQLPARPPTYIIPSHDELDRVAQSSTILTTIEDLQAGVAGKAQITWIALCGAEFPAVAGKIIDVRKSSAFIDFLVFVGRTADEMQGATTANTFVTVWTGPPPQGTPGSDGAVPQPNVAKLQRGDEIRFSGVISTYDSSPFLLHFQKVRVDPTVVP